MSQVQRRAPEPGLGARAILSLLFLGLLYLVFVCAWHSDDAYITFRTARNAWTGHGLVWNPGERVQSYTNPLWMLVALVCYGLFHDVYYSTLIVSMILALSAAALIVRRAWPDPWLAATALLLLADSGAFIDFSTSGLETPLLFLLLALFAGRDWSRNSRGSLLGLTVLASAVGLARLDALVLVLPAVLGLLWTLEPRRRSLGPLLTGLLPLIAWELFSLVYYGSLLPNTALAKLNVDIPSGDLFAQGGRYLLDSLRRDPVTLGTITLSVTLTFLNGSRIQKLTAAGLVLHLLYVLRIGGDFMTGRFFAAPFVTAVALLVSVAGRPALEPSESPASARKGRKPLRDPRRSGGVARDGSHLQERMRQRVLAGAVIALCAVGILWPATRWTSGINYGQGLTYESIVGPSGIADERAYYYPTTGLLRLLVYRSDIEALGLPFPPYRGAIEGRAFANSDQQVTVWNEAGFFGYFSGDAKTVIDVWGLADPLLARIPFKPNGPWRIGHYPRPMPAGYLETRRTGRNQVEDPKLAALYDGIALVTRGPLFSRARWREIWRLNTGFY